MKSYFTKLPTSLGTSIPCSKQNTSVKVHLRAEPLNPFDPIAIAIDLDYGTG